MTGKADRRRPLLAAIASIGVIGAALFAPLLIDTHQGSPMSGSTVRAESHDAVTITAPLAILTSPAITLEQGTVSLAGGDESRVGAVLRALVSGGGVDLVIDGARISIDRTAASATPTQTGPEAAALEALGPVVSTLAGFKFRSLTLADSTVVIWMPDGGRHTLSSINANVETERGGLVTAKGKLDFRGEPLDFELAFTAPPAIAQGDAAASPETPINVRLSVKGAHVTASFNGRIGPGERGQITADNAELSIVDMRRAASWLGAAWPAGTGLGSFSTKGQLTLDDTSISFTHAQFMLDGNAATGTLTAKIGTERPSIEGTLAFATFDIAPYAVPSRPYALALAADWLATLGVPGLAAPSLLTEIDADLRISAGSVTRGADRLGRCAASLSVKGGKLYGEIAELELEQGGRGEGQFTVDMAGAEPRYTLRADLRDIDMVTIAAPRLGPAGLDGIGDITLDISARGTSEDDMLASLSGTLGLEMTEGGRIGLDIDTLFRTATAVPSAGPGWGPPGAGTTTVSRLAARLTARSGVLRTDSVEAQLPERTVGVVGTIDLDRTDLDLVVSITRAAEAAEPDNAKPAAAFRIRGPWSAPMLSPADPGKAARGTGFGSDPSFGSDPG